jgi:hypothetical protein
MTEPNIDREKVKAERDEAAF